MKNKCFIKFITVVSCAFITFFSNVTYSADYYWVGGSGSWNQLTKWASTSNGAGGAYAVQPGSNDNVFFDINSGITPTSIISLPAGVTSTCANLSFATGVLGYKFSGVPTSRFDSNGDVTFETGMDLSDWNGSWWYYQSSNGVTRTITTANVPFKNELIRFEKPSAGTGGNIDVMGDFSQDLYVSTLNNLYINLQLKAQTLTFNDNVIFPGVATINVGTVNTKMGYGNYNNPNTGLSVLALGILHNEGDVNASILYIIGGEVRLNNDNSSSGHTLAYRSVHEITPAAGSILDFHNCHMTITGEFTFGAAYGLPASSVPIIATNSTLQFLATATGMRTNSHSFNNIIVDESNVTNGTFNFMSVGPPGGLVCSIDTLIIDRNCVFFSANSSSAINYEITGLLKFTLGHRYKSNPSETTLSLIGGANVEMIGNCDKPIWLEGFKHDFTGLGILSADYIIFQNNNIAVGPATPYSAGINSIFITGVNTIGWDPTVRTPRILAWVGPSAINNKWYDSQNWVDITAIPLWTSNSSISPNNPGYAPTCPPTEIDSIIFPNNSFVFCDLPIMYCEGMNWMGNGEIVGSNLQDLEIWGSLYESPQMSNSFMGTVHFKSNRTYRCKITTSNHPFNSGVNFNSENSNGSWLLMDSLIAPFYDWELGGPNLFSVSVRSGHLFTGTADCTTGNGQTISAWGMSLIGGTLSLFDSDIHINGYATNQPSGNAFNFYFNGGTLNAGTSHILFKNTQSLSTFGGDGDYHSKARLEGGHTFYEISCEAPTINTPTTYSHKLSFGTGVKVWHVNLGMNVWPEIQSSSNVSNPPFIQNIIGITSMPVTIGSGASALGGISDVNKVIVIDSLSFSGNALFNIQTKINSRLNFSPGSNIDFSAGISVTLSAPFSYTSAYAPICPGGGIVSYTGASMMINGNCFAGNTIVNNGSFINNSPITLNASNLIINNNTVTGSGSTPFNVSNTILNGVTTGWNGSLVTPRKLHWIDNSAVPANSGDWQNGNYWEEIDYTTNTVIAPAPQCPPTQIDTVLFDNLSFSAINQVVNLNGITDVASMYWENIPAGQAPILQGLTTQNFILRGNLYFHANMVNNHLGDFYFKGTPTMDFPLFYIRSSNIHFRSNIDFLGDTDSTTWYQLDPLYQEVLIETSSNGINDTRMFFNRGKYYTNGHNMTISKFSSTIDNKRLLNFENDTITLISRSYSLGISYLWQITGALVNGSVANFTLQATNSVLNSEPINPGIINSYFDLGGKTYNIINSFPSVNGGSSLFRIYPNAFRRDSINTLTVFPNTGAGICSIFPDSIYISRADVFRTAQISSKGGQYDTLNLFENGNITTSNRYNKLLHFEPGKTYNLTENTVQWIKNEGELELNGGSALTPIQFYGLTSATNNRAYIRKDTTYLCADYVNIRDIWAIGNGNDPANSCTSYGNSPVNTITADPNQWIVSNADTITDLTANCGPWTSDPLNHGRGRADFNGGQYADFQGGNVFGWARVGYPPAPIISLVDTSYNICQGESVTLVFNGIGGLPFKLTYYVNGIETVEYLNDVNAFDNYNLITGEFQYSVIFTPTVDTDYNLGFLEVERCFGNISPIGIGEASVTILPCILAVQLKDFTAITDELDVFLNWSTISEMNNDHFIIQRSLDGQEWTDITIIAGNGTTNNQNDYSYKDIRPFGQNQILYYRLKQVDTDGSADILPIRSVKKSIGSSFSVFPNPFNDYLTIIGKGNFEYEVFDLAGRIFNNGIGTDSVILPTKDLLNGVYFIKIKSNSNQTENFKLLKE